MKLHEFGLGLVVLLFLGVLVDGAALIGPASFSVALAVMCLYGVGLALAGAGSVSDWLVQRNSSAKFESPEGENAPVPGVVDEKTGADA